MNSEGGFKPVRAKSFLGELALIWIRTRRERLISNIFNNNKMENALKIRSHHLVCIPRFYHGGYDENFARNMKKSCAIIRKRPNIKVRVLVGRLDYLCIECPHKYKNDCIQSKEIGKWVVAQDKKVAKYLKLKTNSVHTAKEIFNLSMDKINEETIKSVCKDCIFLNNCIKVGINIAFRKDLNKN